MFYDLLSLPAGGAPALGKLQSYDVYFARPESGIHTDVADCLTTLAPSPPPPPPPPGLHFHLHLHTFAPAYDEPLAKPGVTACIRETRLSRNCPLVNLAVGGSRLCLKVAFPYAEVPTNSRSAAQVVLPFCRDSSQSGRHNDIGAWSVDRLSAEHHVRKSVHRGHGAQHAPVRIRGQLPCCKIINNITMAGSTVERPIRISIGR